MMYTNTIIVSNAPCVDGLPDYFIYIRFQGYEDPLLCLNVSVVLCLMCKFFNVPAKKVLL